MREIAYLLELVWFFFGGLLLLRMLFQWFGAEFQNPICQFTYKLTQPVVGTLQRVVPQRRNLNTGALVAFVLLAALYAFVSRTMVGQVLGPWALVVLAAWEALSLLINLYIGLIIIQAILSWMGPQVASNPAWPLLYRLTEPMLTPLRRFIPPIAGIDLTPMILLVMLMLTKMIAARLFAALLSFP